MVEEIQFIANCKGWQAIKKLKIDDNVPPIDVADFLASISLSFDNKLFEYVGKIVDIKQLDDFSAKLVSGKLKKEEDFALVLKEITGVNASKLINSLIPVTADNKTKDKLKEYMKVYLLRKILKVGNLTVDYSGVPIPINKDKK
ncbi:MAG: hypothetical protein COT55_00660 [Candidatus Diapherotrites archaeon CG09_land_8_20_14_0_10_32_12]|nr:MAG: hypothetical protein COT55_00660 [Candidatus Diapherotrites archaeon CG09_land_8_20_14_0_10_32_12]